MFKVKMMIAAFSAALALTAVVASTASATAGWLVNGTELTGTQSANLSTLAVTDTSAILHVPALPVKISCSGHLEGVSPKIAAPNTASATSLTFTGCSMIEPTTCKLPSPEIKTEAVTGTATLGPGESVLISFKPTTAKRFAEFTFEGTSCSISGKKAVTGAVVLKAPTGQLQLLTQALEGLGSLEQGGDSIQVANDQAYIEGGKALLTLESDSKWSFH
jgi:hypothetical protein